MKTVALSEITEIINGFAFESENFNNNGFGLPIVRIRDVVRGFSKTYFAGDYNKTYEVQNGDLLIGMDGEFNIAQWNGGKALLNQRVCKVIAKENVSDLKYLRYRLSLLLKEIEDKTPFVTVKHLSSDELKESKIELPNLKEQKRIAAILDRADRLRRQRRFAQTLSDSFLQSVFIKMFGDPVSNSMNWEKCQIDNVISYSEYGTSEKSNNQKKGYPILGMGNVSYSGEINLSSLSYVELSAKEFEKLKLEKGDIIFNRTNSTELVGKVASWKSELDAVIASYLVKLKLKKNTSPDYFVRLLNTPHYKNLFQERCKKAVGQSNISPTLLKEFPMILPPLPLQEKFAEIVRKFERVRRQQREAARHATHLFQTLLDRAFRGEL